MAEKEYVLNDNFVIPDDIKKMTKDELKEAIRKLEKSLEEKKKHDD